MSDLVAFLRARLDEDEAAAKAASSDHPCDAARGGVWRDVGLRHFVYQNAAEDMRVIDVTGGPCLWYEQIRIAGDHTGETVTAHIARHDPARVLREVAAKRAIVAEHDTLHWRPGIDALKDCQWTSWPCPTLRHVAAVYAGHPDYDEAWKP